jgi:hypothetical protein
MSIKEDFATFKSTVDTKLASIEAKIANPATPAEVAAGMKAITDKLTAIDTATVVPDPSDPL